jgi:hypothetical protein
MDTMRIFETSPEDEVVCTVCGEPRYKHWWEGENLWCGGHGGDLRKFTAQMTIAERYGEIEIK